MEDLLRVYQPKRTLVWFSCGAASAVAAKLAVEKYGAACQVVYCDTLSTEHPDNKRFFDDVEKWLGVPIHVIRAANYASIDEVFQKHRYMSGVGGARCTTEMKKMPRLAYQEHDDSHISGYTVEEQRRANLFEKHNPALDVEWLLIDEGVTKADCLRRLEAAGIALPVMYSLGSTTTTAWAASRARPQATGTERGVCSPRCSSAGQSSPGSWASAWW
jgi:hypothetical protein